MAAVYFARWTSAIGDTADTPEMRAWAADMQALTMAQIDAGMRECRNAVSEWPPSPGQFKAWCLGIPSFAAVKRETLGPNDQRSAFTRAVWARIDLYQHRIASVRDGDRMLQEAYDQVRDQVMRGEALPDIAGVLTHDTNPKPAGIPETRDARAERLRKLLGDDYNPKTADPEYNPTQQRIDHMRQLYNPPSRDEE